MSVCTKRTESGCCILVTKADQYWESQRYCTVIPQAPPCLQELFSSCLWISNSSLQSSVFPLWSPFLQVSATVKCFLDASFALGKLRHSEVLLLQVSHHTYLLLPRAGSLLDQRGCPGMNSLMQPLDLLSARSRAPDVHWDNWLRLRSPLKCRAQNSSCEPRWICSKREHTTAYLPSSLLCSGHEAKQEEGVWSKIHNRRQK